MQSLGRAESSSCLLRCAELLEKVFLEGSAYWIYGNNAKMLGFQHVQRLVELRFLENPPTCIASGMTFCSEGTHGENRRRSLPDEFYACMMLPQKFGHHADTAQLASV